MEPVDVTGVTITGGSAMFKIKHGEGEDTLDLTEEQVREQNLLFTPKTVHALNRGMREQVKFLTSRKDGRSGATAPDEQEPGFGGPGQEPALAEPGQELRLSEPASSHAESDNVQHEHNPDVDDDAIVNQNMGEEEPHADQGVQGHEGIIHQEDSFVVQNIAGGGQHNIFEDEPQAGLAQYAPRAPRGRGGVSGRGRAGGSRRGRSRGPGRGRGGGSGRGRRAELSELQQRFVDQSAVIAALEKRIEELEKIIKQLREEKERDRRHLDRLTGNG